MNTKLYLCKPKFIPSMGSISPFNVRETRYQSKEEDALWQLNKMREHDGQQPFKTLPAGIEFEYQGKE